MGKIKRSKFQFHSLAPKSTDAKSVVRNAFPQNLTPSNSNQTEELGPKEIQNNVFCNIVIPPSVLKQQLPADSYTSYQKKEKFLKIREPFPLSVDFKKKLIEQKKVPKKSRLRVAQVAAGIAKESDKEKNAKEEKKNAALSDWKVLKDALPQGIVFDDKHMSMSKRDQRRMISQQRDRDQAVFFSAIMDFDWERMKRNAYV